MPKGVEHVPRPQTVSILNDVSSSVMPKGVEHSCVSADASVSRIVSSSVMPKGVEHQLPFIGPALPPPRVEFSDAERR